MSSIMTMLIPAATDARETRELSAIRPAEPTKRLGDCKRKDLKNVAQHPFSSTLRAAARAQGSRKVEPKTESVESRPAQESRRRSAEEHRELPVRSDNDCPFPDEKFLDNERGSAQPAVISSGSHDEHAGSEPTSTLLTLVEPSEGLVSLVSQDRSERLPALEFDGTNPELLAWVRGDGSKTVGMSLLESEATQHDHETMEVSDSIAFPGRSTTASSSVAATLLEMGEHKGAAQKHDKNGTSSLSLRSSVLLGEVSLGGPSAGSHQERQPVKANGIAWPLVNQASLSSPAEKQEPTIPHDHAVTEVSPDAGRAGAPSGGLEKVAEASAQARRSAFFLDPNMVLSAVSSPSTAPAMVPRGEESKTDLSILFSNLRAPFQGESQVGPQESIKQAEETMQVELQNQGGSAISPASGQEQVMRLIQRPEAVPVTGMLPQSTPAEGRHLDDGVPTLRAATVGFAQETAGAVLPRAVAFEVSGPELGHVNVRVAVRNELVHAHMVSDRPEVAAYLATGHDRLQSALQASGLEMGHFRVDVDHHGANRSFHQHASPEQRGAWQSEQRKPESLRDQTDWSSRSDRLDIGLLNVVA